MYEIVYMKAEFEPWWMFTEWEDHILSRHSFEEEAEARSYLESVLTKLRKTYDQEKVKKGCFFALWSESERSFCEACDDDLQIYHGIILLSEGKPFIDCD